MAQEAGEHFPRMESLSLLLSTHMCMHRPAASPVQVPTCASTCLLRAHCKRRSFAQKDIYAMLAHLRSPLL